MKPTEKWNLKGLKSVFSERFASKIWGGVSEVQLKENSTPSPWKRRKTTSSAIFCATSAWGLNFHQKLKYLYFETLFTHPSWKNLKPFVGGSSACENCVPETWQTSPLWGWTNYWSLNIKDELSGGDISGPNRINYESGVEWSWNLKVLIFFI